LPAHAATERARISATERAVLIDGKTLQLEAMPLQSEGLYAFARRLTGGTEAVAAISQLNGKPRKLLAGRYYRVSYEVLTEDRKLAVLRALFPQDRAAPDAWTHVSRGEALDRVALWLTGSSRNVAALRK